MSQQPDIATVVIGNLVDKLVAEVRAHEATRANAEARIRILVRDFDEAREKVADLQAETSDLKNTDLRIALEIMSPKQRERFEKAAAEAKEIPF